MKNQATLSKSVKRKATPEEVEYYNNFLSKESKRLNMCKKLQISNKVTTVNFK